MGLNLSAGIVHRQRAEGAESIHASEETHANRTHRVSPVTLS
jgi:hypothetical protein